MHLLDLSQVLPFFYLVIDFVVVVFRIIRNDRYHKSGLDSASTHSN